MLESFSLTYTGTVWHMCVPLSLVNESDHKRTKQDSSYLKNGLEHQAPSPL